MGRAYELLRADAQEHLRKVQREIGFRWCRFHGLFHEDMAVVTRRPDGCLLYQWSQVDKVLDFLLSVGLRPFIELNPMPFALAAGPSSMFAWKMNVSPPRSYEEWGKLVEAFALHCLDRYGLDEIRQWHFEVWNEPNLGAFWKGSREDYWKLYRASALALRRVDEGLRVGGPATARGEWIPEFIAYCHESATPLDFVSTHAYPQDEFVEYTDAEHSPYLPGKFFIEQVRRVQREVAESARPDLPIYWTEWNSLASADAQTVSWIHNRYVDDLCSGASVVRYCLELDDASAGMAWWVASDIFEEAGLPMSPFSETYGLLTIQGIPKPSFHAFLFLNRLRGQRLELRTSALPVGCGAVVTEENGIFRAVLFNHQPPSVKAPTAWRDTLQLHWAHPEAIGIAAHLGKGAGSARETWEALGSPHDISPAEESLIQYASMPHQSLERLQASNGAINWSFALQPNEVVFVEFRLPGVVYLPKGSDRPEAQVWDEGMGLGAS